jgi:hypothetical protein
MNRESKCEHDIDEQETAVAEHVCPLCLVDRVAEIEAENKRLRKAAWAMTEYLRKMHMSQHLEQLTASLHAVLEQGDV